MVNRKKVCVSNGSENLSCSTCGRVMKTIDYYTAKVLKREETGRDLSTRTIVTSYTDVAHHTGNICLFCAHEEQKKKRTTGLVMLVGGAILSMAAMMTGLVLSAIAEGDGGDVGAVLGLPMALMCIFLVLAIIGLCIYGEANVYNPRRKFSQDQLFLNFSKRMEKENLQVGIVYLSPLQVMQMKKK